MNFNSEPSELKITDICFLDVDGAPKRCTRIKIMTNQSVEGYDEVRDASSKTYAAIHNVLAIEFRSVDVPWWSVMVNGLPPPLIENGFIKAPGAPGLGIASLNEEVLRAYINAGISGWWEPTDEWNTEFSNDRI